METNRKNRLAFDWWAGMPEWKAAAQNLNKDPSYKLRKRQTKLQHQRSKSKVQKSSLQKNTHDFQTPAPTDIFSPPLGLGILGALGGILLCPCFYNGILLVVGWDLAPAQVFPMGSCFSLNLI